MKPSMLIIERAMVLKPFGSVKTSGKNHKAAAPKRENRCAGVSFQPVTSAGDAT